MSPAAVYRYQFTDQLHEPLPRGWQRLSSANFGEKDDRMWRLSAAGRTPDSWAQDLLRVARVTYLVDKLAGRRGALDGWTRTIDLEIQLADPAPWRPHLDLVADLLNTLTSDCWTIAVTDGRYRQADTEPLTRAEPVSEVALFSGGLDSTAYAANRARHGSGPLLLVAHYTSDKRQQAVIRDVVRRIQPSVTLLQFSQPLRQPTRPGSHSKQKLELSTRSRGLLFLAAATYVAAAHGVPEVAVPENGQLAVNPPLTADRVGACSSRSVHPRTLDLVNRLIRGIRGTIQVVNPLATHTKAGVCRLALDAGLDAGALARTVSCGRPPERRGRGPFAHCGCCYPCLVRRAALWTVLGDEDQTPYQETPWNVPVESDRRDDLIAVLDWLATPFRPRDLVADMPLPQNTSLTNLAAVIDAGRAELRAYLHAALPRDHTYRRWLMR